MKKARTYRLDPIVIDTINMLQEKFRSKGRDFSQSDVVDLAVMELRARIFEESDEDVKR